MRTVIDLPEGQLEKLTELSRRQGRSRAALIREVLADYVGQHEQSERQEAFGSWKDRNVDGLEYQQEIRNEWQ